MNASNFVDLFYAVKSCMSLAWHCYVISRAPVIWCACGLCDTVIWGLPLVRYGYIMSIACVYCYFMPCICGAIVWHCCVCHVCVWCDASVTCGRTDIMNNNNLWISSIAATTQCPHHCMCLHAWHARMHVSCLHASRWHACQRAMLNSLLGLAFMTTHTSARTHECMSAILSHAIRTDMHACNAWFKLESMLIIATSWLCQWNWLENNANELLYLRLRFIQKRHSMSIQEWMVWQSIIFID